MSFLKAALWEHQAHQDMTPPPPLVSAELLSSTQGQSKEETETTQAHKMSQKKDD